MLLQWGDDLDDVRQMYGLCVFVFRHVPLPSRCVFVAIVEGRGVLGESGAVGSRVEVER